MPKKSKPVGADGHRERMREKLLTSGDAAPFMRDLVEMLLYYPIQIRDTRDSAVLLMQMFNDDVEALLNAPADELMRADGIGRSSALFLNVMGEVIQRIKSDEDDKTDPRLSDSYLKALLRDTYPDPVCDELWAIFFDSTMQPLISRFKSDPIELYPQDVYDLLHCAAAQHSEKIILAHMVPRGGEYSSITDAMIADFAFSCADSSSPAIIGYYIVTENGEFSIEAPSAE